jgi:protein-S-isoprenylcysteine O-methyltransferase Ste14
MVQNDNQTPRTETMTSWDSFIRLGLLAVFLFTWSIDSFFLNATIFLSDYIHLVIRLTLSFLALISAIILFYFSIQLLYGSEEFERESKAKYGTIYVINKVLDSGVYGRVRHPLYLGFLFFYLAMFLTTLSLACLFIFLFVILIFDRIAASEEKKLIELYGAEYLEYKKRVRRWIPF